MAIKPLSRRLVEAAAALTNDDPNRMTTVDAVVAALGVPEDAALVAAIAEACRLGWLKCNPGRVVHSLQVAPGWRRAQALKRKKPRHPG